MLVVLVLGLVALVVVAAACVLVLSGGTDSASGPSGPSGPSGLSGASGPSGPTGGATQLAGGSVNARDDRQEIRQVPKTGEIVGTNKAGLRYGDLGPYSKCKIVHRGKWVQNSGDGFGVGQSFYHNTGPVTFDEFLADDQGPQNPDWANFMTLYHNPRTSEWRRKNHESALRQGVELPPWSRSPPLGFMDLIRQYCK